MKYFIKLIQKILLPCKYPWALNRRRLYSKFTARNLIFKIHEFQNCFSTKLLYFGSSQLFAKSNILLGLVFLLVDSTYWDFLVKPHNCVKMSKSVKGFEQNVMQLWKLYSRFSGSKFSLYMWKSNFTREQESKARDSAPTQGFWHSTQNGLDRGDRKIHKYTNTNTHKYKFKYNTHTMDWKREISKTNQTKNIQI